MQRQNHGAPPVCQSSTKIGRKKSKNTEAGPKLITLFESVRVITHICVYETEIAGASLSSCCGRLLREATACLRIFLIEAQTKYLWHGNTDAVPQHQ